MRPTIKDVLPSGAEALSSANSDDKSCEQTAKQINDLLDMHPAGKVIPDSVGKNMAETVHNGATRTERALDKALGRNTAPPECDLSEDQANLQNYSSSFAGDGTAYDGSSALLQQLSATSFSVDRSLLASNPAAPDNTLAQTQEFNLPTTSLG